MIVGLIFHWRIYTSYLPLVNYCMIRIANCHGRINMSLGSKLICHWSVWTLLRNVASLEWHIITTEINRFKNTQISAYGKIYRVLFFPLSKWLQIKPYVLKLYITEKMLLTIYVLMITLIWIFLLPEAAVQRCS